ncbi:putative Prion-inhibition and propagation-domain-containing protein [Seiridium unicorne]|uniref:Prion-inhibition and propagation-domain-containing protein n=1 Tax=Seiridium unicorne TaxID=138068 RepID=A0ABR2V671_9PEZI
MAEIFGTVAGALSVSALFNNCVDCFEYIELGRHFARDYERYQLKVDVARTRLSRWGQAVAINDDPRFATGEPEDGYVEQAKSILVGIGDLFEDLQTASKRYMVRAKQEDLEHLQVENMQPVPQRLHSHLRAAVSRRQKGTSLLQKAAWALYDEKNFRKMINQITEFISALENLFPVKESVRRTLVEIEIEEVDDEPSLTTLQNAAADSDSVMSEVVTKRLEIYGGKNYAKNVQGEESARVRVGNEWTEAALSCSLGPPDQTNNGADSIMAKGTSAVHIGNSYGGRGVFDN